MGYGALDADIGGIKLRVLITGGCGFIGSHTVRCALGLESIEILVNLDALTYSGNPENLIDIDDSRYEFVHGSITDYGLVKSIILNKDIDVILNLAAESHVDRSISSAQSFVETNVKGTLCLLECVKELGKNGKRIDFIQISTDEVYGSLGPNDPAFTEESAIKPRNPYATTKAASDLLVSSFVNTYGISAMITRCSNNYGPNQFPEKLIPLMVTNAINGRSLPIYGDGMQIRDWIHVHDHAQGIIASMKGLVAGRLSPGEVINFGADQELSNIEIVRTIIELTGSDSLIEHVEDRPGHDRRYAMGFDKAKRLLDWNPEIPWEEGIKSTVEWYQENDGWIESVIDGSYHDWIDEHYG